MLLSDIKKPLVRKSFVHEIRYGDIRLKQYHGVFSREKVDMATQFLLDNLIVKEEEKNILDWGCGNGIIGLFIRQKSGPKNIVFMDDNILAVESVRLNEPDADVRWADNLADIPDAFFDLIVTNPPFHFEYETDISVSLSFFEEAKRCLRPEGRLLVVANKHVNYQTHLVRHFRNVEVINENHKFVICQNRNPLP
jgi:16S rRNA G1207 methylase RsmC